MAASNLLTGQSDPRKLTGPHRGDDFGGMTDGQEKAHRRSFLAHRKSIESSMGPRWENVQSGRSEVLWFRGGQHDLRSRHLGRQEARRPPVQ